MLDESPETGSKVPAAEYTRQRIKLWEHIALHKDRNHLAGKFYHQRLSEIYRFLIPPDAKILEIGCGKGDLLSALHPSLGVGIDYSGEMVAQATLCHPEYHFYCADAHVYELEGLFDFIILSDLINDLWDVQEVLTRLQKNCHPGTRIILNYYSRVWLPVLQTAQNLNLSLPQLQQNWLTNQDVKNLLFISGFDVLRQWQECLFPLTLPLISTFFNKFLVKLWPINLLGLANFSIARPASTCTPRATKPLVAVIIPARNEAGNIPEIFARVPEMGGGTELVFVEGHSSDNTYQVIEECIRKYPHRTTKLLKQDGIGKGDAVRKGFSNASGEILMILDADLTVVPEDLPRFYEVLFSGKAEFVNGVRLVYPMEKQAMRFLNLVGNKLFGVVFTWILGQSIKDTLCGTKAMWKKDYAILSANRAYFGDFDPFGDYDLLFGGAKLNLKISDLPIRYRERTYGRTNIQRWRHGLLLLRMTIFAAFRIKFV